MKLIEVFLDRSSSRVADISSVKLRDLILWSIFISSCRDLSIRDVMVNELESRLHYLSSKYDGGLKEPQLLEIIDNLSWGNSL